MHEEFYTGLGGLNSSTIITYYLGLFEHKYYDLP